MNGVERRPAKRTLADVAVCSATWQPKMNYGRSRVSTATRCCTCFQDAESGRSSVGHSVRVRRAKFRVVDPMHPRSAFFLLGCLKKALDMEKICAA